jgi:GTPase
MTDTYSGFIAIVGRPNVGKSSLLNRILGQKIGITSSKPQTTRDYLCGIKTTDTKQAIYIDTPGVIAKSKNLLHKSMNKKVSSAIADADIYLFVLDARGWQESDDSAWEKLSHAKKPVIIVLNKVDLVKDKHTLLPLIAELTEKISAQVSLIDIVPISAKTGHNTDSLEQLIIGQIQQGVHFYPSEQITNKTAKFLVSELIREQLMRYLGDELPYKIAVEIELFKEKESIIEIHGLIWVASDSHKPIVIGKGGGKLKTIGTNARTHIENLLDSKVMLKLWVKVKPNWHEKPQLLKYLGYTD